MAALSNSGGWMMKQRWEWVVEFEGRYLISDGGHIWSVRSRKLLRGTLRNEYKVVCLYNGRGVRQFCYVHTLVLETFVGPRPKGMEARHRNGKRLDNRRRNLTWGTNSENHNDAVKHGTHGSLRMKVDGGTRKLSTADVQWIKENQHGSSQRDIAKRFGVSQQHVSCIINGQKRVRG